MRESINKSKYRQHATVKSILGIVTLLMVFSAIVMVIGYFTFTNALMEQYSDGAYLTAKTAAQLVDADRMDAYVQSDGEGEEYEKVWKDMDRLCNSSGSTFIYVIIPDTTDYAHIKFIFSTIDHTTKYSEYKFGLVKDTTNDEYKQKYRELYEGTADRAHVVRNKGHIETDAHITEIVPLNASDGTVVGLLCVQRQMDVLTRFRNKFFDRIIISLILLIVFVIVGQSFFLHRTLLRPLKLISDEASRFALENTVAEEKLQQHIRNKDEIGALAESIDVMEQQVHDYIDNITKITAEKERIGTELALATRIQADMLPNHFPAFPDRKEFDIFASMTPAKEVGGDFYDFFLIDDDHLCLVIADVSGKGIPAALFMMASKIILANNAMMGKSPAQILTDTNAAICANNREEMFVTVWLGILEISTGKLTAANAGHEYPVIKQADGSFELFKDKHGLVIGGMDGFKFKEYEVQLTKGAKLFVYTDGVPEASNDQRQFFGTQRLLDALNVAPDASPEGMLNAVRNAVSDFVLDAEQYDDLTMLGLEYKGE
jgi:sigma-B regulation protein RsbU (phosphoserine phosphatase)